MAGHSKWKNIKHKKAASDEARMKKFTKLSKEITMAAKFGVDINSNPTLRSLIEKANEINMPKDNYLKAIERAKNIANQDIYESSFYEGYGPCNVSFIVEIISDNKNRSAAEVRQVFCSNGGRVAPPGSVMWQFKRVGIIEGFGNNLIEEFLFESIFDFQICDFSVKEDFFYIATEVNDLLAVKSVLIGNGYSVDEAFVGYFSQEKIELSDEDDDKINIFVEKLESLDDIQNIFYNA